MIAAAHAAGERLKRDFAEIATLEVQIKGNAGDPFSEADLRAEDTVREHLMRARPGYGFLGEEGGITHGSDTEHLWIVDPLDGTMNFLTGVPLWAVNIALARNGELLGGVTYAPMQEETFWAEKGRGAYLNGVRMHVSKRATLAESVIGAGVPFVGKARHKQFAHEMLTLTPRVAAVRRLGSGAIDMAYVACGRFDAFWEQEVKPWDLAPGAILVAEAGGRATGTLGEPLDIMGGTCLVSTPQIHAELVAALAPIDGGATPYVPG
jgi:myo-inositol-1(or 4)-monophosphatase